MPTPRYACLFWDLDGTLTDSREGIVRSVAFALEKLGRTVDHASLDRFAGPPLVRSLRELYALDGEELARAVDLYRDRYLRVGWRENRLVPGMEALLRDLHRAGVSMAVVTVKPRPTAERILKHFDIWRYFKALHAPGVYGLAVDKTDILGEAMGRRAGRRSGPAAIIGDHEGDMHAARALGIDGIAVLYGYGERHALLAAKPTAVANGVEDLRRFLFA